MSAKSNSDSADTESETDYDFLQDVERSFEYRGDITDFEWDIRNRQWDEQKTKIVGQMLQNNIWNMLFHNKAAEGGGRHSIVLGEHSSTLRMSTRATIANSHGHREGPSDKHSLSLAKKTGAKPLKPSAVSNISRISWKVPNMSKLELFRYLLQWDKSSYSKRNGMIMDFIKQYETKEQVYDTDSVFANGGSLIFCRFTVALHICFLKHHKVWHYYDALGIFVKSLQSDRYVEEFVRLGGMNYIIQVVRVEESQEIDKLRALQFLVNLMKSRNGHSVKQFILDSPNLLESLVDSLTMCHNKELIKNCGLVFENLCIEIPPNNIPLVCNYVMHALPCDFNPLLQSMAFKVLQCYIRLKPSLSPKCIKPILDNLKTNDSELLVAISNLSLVILQTMHGDELISALMIAAEGLHLREVFKNVYRSHYQGSKYKTTIEVSQEIHKLREKRERARVKQMKYDQFMHQAGALFVLNQMMTHKVDFVDEFVNKCVFGLSLKTLGSCPHWQVQGQGVTMVKFLYSMSMDCALSYYMMLPPKLLELILSKPEECLRYFTSPICVLLRKLGRFALRMWPRWVEKVVSVAKLYAKGPKIPPELFQLSQMARKVYEIHQQLADLLDSPVMEAAPKTPDMSEIDRDDHREFLDSSDEENMAQYRDGEEVILGDERFEGFRTFVEDQEEFKISEDRLDIRMAEEKSTILMKGKDDDVEADAYEIAMLEEAAGKVEPTAISGNPGQGDEDKGGMDENEENAEENDEDGEDGQEVQNQTVKDATPPPDF